MIVAPQERLEPSKAQTYDDTVVIDEPEWLGGELEDLKGDQSTRRYTKPGQVQKLRSDLPMAMQQYCVHALENLENIMIGRRGSAQPSEAV